MFRYFKNVSDACKLLKEKRNTEDSKKGGKHTTLLFPPSISILFPITTKGKFSGSEGFA
jgi:hypothetical protein